MTIIQATPLKQYGISGPASALDNELPSFDGITGKKIQAGTGITIPSTGRVDLSEVRAKDGNGLKLYEDGGSGLFVKDGGAVGLGTLLPSGILHLNIGTGGAGKGLVLDLTAESGDIKKRYGSIDFKSYTSGLIGQFLSTGNTYANGGFNQPANSLGLWAEAATGSLSLGAGGANGDIRFTTGGYGPGNEKMRIDKDGVGIGTTVMDKILNISKSQNIPTRIAIKNTNTGAAAQVGLEIVNDTGESLWTVYGSNCSVAALQDTTYFASQIGGYIFRAYTGKSIIFGRGSTYAGMSKDFVIGTDGKIAMGAAAPATSALLDLTSTTGALLLTRMTTAQRDALTAVNGMALYNSTLNKFQGYENGAWTNLI